MDLTYKVVDKTEHFSHLLIKKKKKHKPVLKDFYSEYLDFIYILTTSAFLCGCNSNNI